MSCTSGNFALTELIGLHHPRRMAVSGIDYQNSTFPLPSLRTLEIVALAPMAAADAQTALRIFCGIGILQFFLNVFDGDEALEVIILVDDEQLLDAMPVQNQLGFLKRSTDRNRDQVLLGHDLGDGQIRADSNRRSRLVRMPTSLRPCVTGIPEIR